jgi:hypothetical protein
MSAQQHNEEGKNEHRMKIEEPEYVISVRQNCSEQKQDFPFMRPNSSLL